jgi:hypothetical protein
MSRKLILLAIAAAAAQLVSCTTEHRIESRVIAEPVIDQQTTEAIDASPKREVKPIGLPLRFVGNYKEGADARLIELLHAAARDLSGYTVEAFSGYRKGDKRYHGKGAAIDVRLVDMVTGKALPNYQNESSFRTYERFAQLVRSKQLQMYPKMPLRWGGYFSGGPGVYGAVDLMHFDIAPAPMGGGSWETGLTAEQRKLWPRAQSAGIGKS